MHTEPVGGEGVGDPRGKPVDEIAVKTVRNFERSFRKDCTWRSGYGGVARVGMEVLISV